MNYAKIEPSVMYRKCSILAFLFYIRIMKGHYDI